MHQISISPPSSISELQSRANNLAGQTIGELANKLNEQVPTQLHHTKGWVGQLLEKALGANAGNLDLPDFMHLGIELKTLPLNAKNQPQESTYLCRIQLPIQENDFFQSRAWTKLARILWVPIQAQPNIPIQDRLLGTPLLWSACAETREILQTDWLELTELMRLGYFEELSAKQGQYLQVRPKAANSKVLTKAINHLGQEIAIVPKGFYLRTQLTQKILSQHYALA